VAMYVYSKACRVSIIEPGRSSREVIADLVVSLNERGFNERRLDRGARGNDI